MLNSNRTSSPRGDDDDIVKLSPRRILSRLFKLQAVHLDPKNLKSSAQQICTFIKNNRRYIADGKTSFDCFISYRVSSELQLATTLFYLFKSEGLHPFLDRECLEDGAPWKEGFLRGLRHSSVVVPLLSSEGLKPFKDASRDFSHDNLLLEFQTALQMNSSPSNIFPVLVGHHGYDGVYTPFHDLNENLYSVTIKRQNRNYSICLLALTTVIFSAICFNGFLQILQQQKIDALIQWGDSLFSNANYTEAERTYKDVLVYQPTNIRAYFQLGQISEKLNLSDKATSFYKTGMEYKCTRCMLRLGALYLKQEETVFEAVNLFHLASSQEPEALYNLGVVYHRGVPPLSINYSLAVNYLKAAAERNSTKAMAELGSMLPVWQCTICEKPPISEEECMQYLRMAEQRNNSLSLVVLGNYYSKRQESENLVESYYKKAIALGNSDGFSHFGNYLIRKGNVSEAIKILKEGTELNCVTCHYELAFFFHFHKNEFQEAIHHYEAAVIGGHPNAMISLGYLFWKGAEGVQSNISRAISLLEEAHSVYHRTLGGLGLAIIYQEPNSRNLSKAVAVLEEIVSRVNLSQAFFNLGFLYLDEELNMSHLSHEMFERASSFGTGETNYDLCQLYFRGLHCVAKNYSKAFHYCRLADQQGHATASHFLGSAYNYGLKGVVEIDVYRAIEYYRRATERDPTLEIPKACLASIYVNTTRVIEAANTFLENYDCSKLETNYSRTLMLGNGKK